MLEVKGLQPIWDKTIIDLKNTTADFTVGIPIKREKIFTADQAWEKGMVHYGNVIFDAGKYKMYYITHMGYAKKQEYADNMQGTTIEILDTYVCYAESDDGLHWERPALGLYEYEGNKNNNIILRSIDKPEAGGFFDNFFVFIDTNPKCAPEKRYKATAYMNYYKIGGYTSPDGIHWTLDAIWDVEGKFDTLNVCWWDERIQKYVAYVRDFHDIPDNGDINAGIRDARRMESDDFLHWTTPERILFPDTEDYPIYTNQIMRYYRNPDIYIGFPTRYEERPDWSDSFEQLCGREQRLSVMKKARRYGLTVTDCIFMSSRDGLNFDKCDEALFVPGYEFDANWIYGNCYPVYFMAETSVGDGENKEVSMLVAQYYNHGGSKYSDIIEQWTLRIDGFACYKAKYSGARVVTKPFVFEGDELYINFSTSAKGKIFITIRDEEGRIAKTCELFGDAINRKVSFENTSIAEFSQKPIVLEFEMKDAKLYAFEFKKKNTSK